ncbi:MAG TPA: glycosyltransferase family 39 protein [Verrucomicrobiae bacterium]|nr:glycosyltransferase family 39 protein [Verrucomicrobiae bacterium]
MSSSSKISRRFFAGGKQAGQKGAQFVQTELTPQTFCNEGTPESFRATTIQFVILLMTALLCFGIHNDWPGHEQSDELYYLTGGLLAERTGDYLIPSYHGQERLQKPPLNYWLVALSYRLFGRGLWQGRLPSVLAGVSSVALTWWLGLLLFRNRRVALYGACALMSSYVIISRAHTAHTDMVLGCLVLGSFCGFAVAFTRDAWWGSVLAWVFLGGATMTKGPIGFLIPFCTVLAWMAFLGRRKGVRWSRLFSPVGLTLFLAIVLPWPLLVLAEESGRGTNVIGPVATEIGFHLIPVHGESSLSWWLNLFRGVFYFVVGAFQRIFPWSVLLLVFLKRSARTTAVWLLLLWGLGTALVFGVILDLHRTRYLIPMMPAFALLCGYALAQLQALKSNRPFVLRLFIWSLDITIAAASIMAVLMWAGARLSFVDHRLSLLLAVLTFAVSVSALCLVRWLRRCHPTGSDWITAAACSLCVLITLVVCSWKLVFPINPAFEIARRNLREQPASAKVAAVGMDFADVSWAWLGAGRNFDYYGRAFERSAGEAHWTKLSAYQFILCGPGTAAKIPQSLFRVVDSLEGSDTEFSLIWPLRSVRNSTARWQKNQRRFLLLERQNKNQAGTGKPQPQLSDGPRARPV